MTTPPILLASASAIRAELLTRAGLSPRLQPARIDEEAIRQAHLAEGGAIRDLAPLLASLKAARVAPRFPDALTIGADQILLCDGQVLAKPVDRADAARQLAFLSGKTHSLLTAAVVCQGQAELWRHLSEPRLTMHALSPAFIEDYLDRTWDQVRHSVGCYQIEGEGPRLFSGIDGDFFAIQGLPLIELLTWLTIRGDIAI